MKLLIKSAIPAFALAVTIMSRVPVEGVVIARHMDLRLIKNRPVTKVIALLKDMTQQLQKEADEDAEIYDKMSCWCKTNDADKTQAISEAETRISKLGYRIEELAATSARLGAEIENLRKEIKDNQQALAQALSIREKQMAEFTGEEKDLLESVSALKAAIVVLSKHNGGGALVQIAHSRILSIGLVVSRALQYTSMLKGVLTPRELKLAAAFAQAPEDYIRPSQSYGQSGEIFGILKQMLESFESNLSDSQKVEMANQKSFQELKTAKESEIKAEEAQLDAKEVQLAAANEEHAQSKQDVADTRASLSTDEQFLMMLKEKCQLTDKEWEERQKTRQEEIQAVSQALAVLSSDDAHDLVTRTFNPAFIQSANTKHSNKRQQVSKMLLDAGARYHNPMLAALATQAQLEAFTRVKKAIDDMVTQLLKEKEDEFKHKDYCTDEINSNQQLVQTTEHDKEKNVGHLQDLEMKIEALTDEIAGLKKEISEMNVQIKRAGEDRELANKEFQSILVDQRETQKLLTKAIQVLKQFYDKAKPALVQDKARGPPPPSGFKEYQNHAGSGGVVGLLQQIMNDAATMEKETVQAEEDAQTTYEEFVKDSNNSIEKKTKAILNKSDMKSTAEVNRVSAEAEKKALFEKLERLSNFNAELHISCDFVLKNFDIRQTARDEEIDALRQAKAILSSADVSS